MANKTRDKVRDGYLGDLPEPLRVKVMNIHKLIKSTVDELIEEANYDDLKSSRWAMSCIDEFCAMPKDQSDVGSIRVCKSGPKNFRCMIQATGHFRNHQYGWIEELLHDFIGNVYTTVRPIVRKKYDMTITNEGRTGNPFEGFDIYPPPKQAQAIWDSLEDRKTKTVTEAADESVDYDDRLITEKKEDSGKSVTCGFKKLPKGLSSIVNELNGSIKSLIETGVEDEKYKEIRDNKEELKNFLYMIIGKTMPGAVGTTTITCSPMGTYTGTVTVTPEPDEPAANKLYDTLLKEIEKKLAPDFKKNNPGKRLVLTGQTGKKFFIITLDNEYAKKLFLHIQSPKIHPMTEATQEVPTPSYNTEMSPAEAKRTLRTLSQSLINDFKANKSKKMTQYTANIYANVISKNLLPQWAGSFRRFSITLDDYQSFFTVEFKVPKMTQDFVSRFIQGRESLEGFLHRQPEIKMKISPRVFHTMKSPDDAYNFFKAAIIYYDKKIGKAGERLMSEAMKLNTSMKHLIGTTKLSGIVTYPMSLLFIFDDVHMDDKSVFELSADDIKTVSSFIRNISSHYAAPEKEKSKIISDVQDMVKALREAAIMDENIAELGYLPEAVRDLFAGKYDPQMQEAMDKWMESNVDHMAMREEQNPELKYIREAFGVKKLKKIPADLVAYIQIEAECIKDANDKMMISSYCLSKIEIVEWYIELLDTGSKKYVVPHTKPYLESVRTQLLACFKKIMATPIPKPGERPIIDIKYPKGYEG